MQYSVNLFPFTSALSWLPAYPLEETVGRLAAAGFDAVELACAAPHAWPDYTTPERVAEIKSCLEREGVKCSSIVVPSGGGPGLNAASRDPLERREAVRLNRRAVDIGCELDCPLLIYVGGWQCPGTPRRQAWDYTVEGLREVAGYAAEKGMLVCIEPTAEDNNLVESAEDALELMRVSGMENVQVMFDTEHVLYRMEDPVDYVASAGSCLRHLHVTDRGRLPPGKGEYGFLPLLQALKDTGYRGYVTLETAFGRQYRPFEALSDALGYLKELEKMLK